MQLGQQTQVIRRDAAWHIMPWSVVKTGVGVKGGILVSKLAAVWRLCIILLLGSGEGFQWLCSFALIFSSFLLNYLYTAPRVFLLLIFSPLYC